MKFQSHSLKLKNISRLTNEPDPSNHFQIGRSEKKQRNNMFPFSSITISMRKYMYVKNTENV